MERLTAAKRFLRQARKPHDRPERIVIDGRQTDGEVILSIGQLQDQSARKLKPIRIRRSVDLNNRIRQDHRAIKRRARSMLGSRSVVSARVILGGIKMIQMMRNQLAKYACNPQPSLAELLAA